MKKRMSVVGLWLALAAATVSAASLREAVEQAWQRHPEAVAAPAREAQAAAEGDAARSLTAGPAALSVSTLNDRLNDDRGKAEWEVELGVPLWLPGQKAARAARAESLAAETRARQAALRLAVAGEVRDAWWLLAGARQAHELATRRLESAQALQAQVERRYRMGDLARIDANLARNEAATAQAEVRDADVALAAAALALETLIGARAPAQLDAEPLAVAGGLEAHPALAAAAAQSRLARASLRLAEETRREPPELAVRMVRERGVFAEPYSNTVGVKLTIPFSSRPRVRAETFAAQAEADRADADMARAERRQRLALERARFELGAAERQLETARERQAAAADSLQLAERSFALGETDLVRLLRHRAAAFEAEAFLQRQRVALAAARSALNQALGVLP